MFKSDFAKECCKSTEALNDDQDMKITLMEPDADVNRWFSHDRFKEMLDKKESSITKSSSHMSLHSPMSSHRSSLSSHISRHQSSAVLPTSSLVTSNNINRERDEMERLEAENIQLRRQLEMVSKNQVLDSKYANLAAEVVRLQNSVNQVIDCFIMNLSFAIPSYLCTCHRVSNVQ